MKELFLIIFLSFIIQINSLDLEKIRADILTNHNYHRKNHQVGNLARNTVIEKVAQDYSEYLASENVLQHSGNNKYGENLYYCWSSYGVCITGEKASQSWYNEVDKYKFDNPGFSSTTGHFTQLVWKGSKEIGCGAACNNQNNCYITCNYFPPGNYLGQFGRNVFPKIEITDKEDDTEDDSQEKEQSSSKHSSEDGSQGSGGDTSSQDGNISPKNVENTGVMIAEKIVLILFSILLIL